MCGSTRRRATPRNATSSTGISEPGTGIVAVRTSAPGAPYMTATGSLRPQARASAVPVGSEPSTAW